MTTRTEEDLRRRVREIVLELAPGAEKNASVDPLLVEELEYHSLALLELAFALEDEFDLQPIDEASVQSIKSASHIEDYVLRQLREPESHTAMPEPVAGAE